MENRITDKMASTASEILKLIRNKEVTILEAQQILHYATDLLTDEVGSREF